MDTTVGALKVGTQLVMGKYGVDKDSPHPIVWLKGNPNCDFITEKSYRLPVLRCGGRDWAL